MNFLEKLKDSDYGVLVLLTLLVLIGGVMLYDAGGQRLAPWCLPHLFHFLLGLTALLLVAMTPVSWLLKIAYPFYGISLFLLVLVDAMGHIGGLGAQRWLDLYFFKIQPSECMRLSLVLVLACYFHRRSPEETQELSTLMVPLLLVIVPVAFILRQPNLGTALLLLMTSAIVFFGAGVPRRYFLIVLGTGLVSIPVLWSFLHKYQKNRILTFLNPERDPLGAGYHILQSKIALGSGGFWGKGFAQGTQSHLNFLPEKHTDFIFTMLAEEWGFVGSVGLIVIFGLLIFWGLKITAGCRSTFTRLIALGMTGSIFLYMFINIAMVMGLMPVVGLPLPFVSHGGTSLVALMMGAGLLLNTSIHKDDKIRRYY